MSDAFSIVVFELKTGLEKSLFIYTVVLLALHLPNAPLGVFHHAAQRSIRAFYGGDVPRIALQKSLYSARIGQFAMSIFDNTVKDCLTASIPDGLRHCILRYFFPKKVLQLTWASPWSKNLSVSLVW